MTVQEIKTKLMKEAIVFSTGGIRPTNELLESWIGKVSWKKDMESIPKDVDRNEMNPLATLSIARRIRSGKCNVIFINRKSVIQGHIRCLKM